MPTYEYETIPSRPGERPVRFELYQPITAAPLTHHPETGVPVRRVVSGGLAVLTDSRVSEPPPACGSGRCGLGQECSESSCGLPTGGCQGGLCGIDA